MRLGKLTNEELKSIVLRDINLSNKEILRGGAISEDCAAIQCEDIILVTTDPITAQCDNVGSSAIHICANDIAASGGTPFACLVTLLAHPNESLDNLSKILQDLNATASELSIDVIGGHTEFTDAVNRTIISVTMLGKTKKFVSSFDFDIGDEVFVIGNIGKEGTEILLSQYRDRLCSLLGEIEYAETFADCADISVLKIGTTLSSLNLKMSMHDITEGGVFGAIAEMCEARGLGANLDEKKIPIKNATKKICAELGINPYGLISSGSMLCVSSHGDKIRAILDGNRFTYGSVGKICARKGVFVKGDNGEYEVFTKADELFSV